MAMKPSFIHLNVSYDGLPRYRGISISTVMENVAEFSSGDPMTDWKAMRAFCIANPGVYMATSSFEGFVWDVPRYQFILDDTGNEVLVPIPEISDDIATEPPVL
jgi:hypothetical protein